MKNIFPLFCQYLAKSTDTTLILEIMSSKTRNSSLNIILFLVFHIIHIIANQIRHTFFFLIFPLRSIMNCFKWLIPFNSNIFCKSNHTKISLHTFNDTPHLSKYVWMYNENGEFETTILWTIVWLNDMLVVDCIKNYHFKSKLFD